MFAHSYSENSHERAVERLSNARRTESNRSWIEVVTITKGAAEEPVIKNSFRRVGSLTQTEGGVGRRSNFTACTNQVYADVALYTG